MANIEMVIDSIRVSLMNYQKVVILKEKEGERYLPIWIDAAVADAIAVKMQNVYVPRPLTHDFCLAIVHTFEGTVKHVIISDLKNDTFYAKVVLESGGKQSEIDCRPSDALAVAVRADAPIFADEKLAITDLYLGWLMVSPPTRESLRRWCGKTSGMLSSGLASRCMCSTTASR